MALDADMPACLPARASPARSVMFAPAVPTRFGDDGNIPSARYPTRSTIGPDTIALRLGMMALTDGQHWDSNPLGDFLQHSQTARLLRLGCK